MQNNQLTTFEGVKKFHEVSGCIFPEKPKVPTKSEVHLGLSLIAEEFVELLKDGFGLDKPLTEELESVLLRCISDVAGIIDYNPIQSVDALGDIIFVVYRLGGVLGFDMNKVDDLIYNSNMSKFHKLGEDSDACRAVQQYTEKGRQVHKERVGEYIVIKDSYTNKVLKGSNFKEPNLTEVVL